MSDLPPAPALPAGDPAPAAPGVARSLIISGIWMTRQELIAALGSEVPLAVQLPLLRYIEPIDHGTRYLLHLGGEPVQPGEEESWRSGVGAAPVPPTSASERHTPPREPAPGGGRE